MWTRALCSKARVFLAGCALIATLGQAGLQTSVGQEGARWWLVSEEPRAYDHEKLDVADARTLESYLARLAYPSGEWDL